MKDATRIWLAVLPAMVLPFIASLLYFVLLSDSTAARAVYAGTKLFTVAWPVLAVCVIVREKLPPIRLRPAKQLKAALFGAAAAVPIVVLMAVLMRTCLGQVIAGGSDKILAKARQFGILEHYWLFAILLSLVHSLVEEYYWRWFVFGRLRKVTGVLAAHILAGVAFGGHHAVIGTQFFSLFWGLVAGVPVAAAGVAWSVMYYRQKTIAGAWACHLIVDLYIMGIGCKLLLANG
jgi:membrane protease YdiL (CAAX protease family)